MACPQPLHLHFRPPHSAGALNTFFHAGHGKRIIGHLIEQEREEECLALSTLSGANPAAPYTQPWTRVDFTRARRSQPHPSRLVPPARAN